MKCEMPACTRIGAKRARTLSRTRFTREITFISFERHTLTGKLAIHSYSRSDELFSRTRSYAEHAACCISLEVGRQKNRGNITQAADLGDLVWVENCAMHCIRNRQTRIRWDQKWKLLCGRTRFADVALLLFDELICVFSESCMSVLVNNKHSYNSEWLQNNHRRSPSPVYCVTRNDSQNHYGRLLILCSPNKKNMPRYERLSGHATHESVFEMAVGRLLWLLLSILNREWSPHTVHVQCSARAEIAGLPSTKVSLVRPFDS